MSEELILALGKKRKTVTWRHLSTTWEGFKDTLRKTRRSGVTMEEYAHLPKDDRDKLKEQPGCFCAARLKDGLRTADHVLYKTLIVLDADTAHSGGDDADGWKKDWRMFTLLHDDVACVCWPTHSSTPKRPKLRWAMPVSRNIQPDEFPAVARRVAEWVGIDTMDPSTFDINRFFYYPCVPSDAPYELLEQDGDPVDVDEVLASYGAQEAWKDASLWPVVPGEPVASQRKTDPAADPRGKDGPVGVFCNAYDVPTVIDEFLSDVYEPTAQADRYTYLNGSTAGGAIVYNEGLFLYSNHATDPAHGHSVNAFDLVRIHKFGHLDEEDGVKEGTPPNKLPSYKAMVEWMQDLPDVQAAQREQNDAAIARQFEDMLSTGAICATEAAGTTGTTDAFEPEDAPDKKDKKDKKGRKDTGGKGLGAPNLNNAIRILETRPEFAGKLARNEMDDTIQVTGELPWWGLRERRTDARSLLRSRQKRAETEEEKEARQLREALAGQRTPWKEGDWPEYYAVFERLGYKLKGGTSGVLDNALKVVAGRHAYHPIRDYLHDLVWDGKERLDTLFIRWLGAEDNKLNRAITRLWMIAAVDRVFRPGCQFDEILITVGDQGIGKSKLLRLLAHGFFTSSIRALDVGKATCELLQGIWIAEIGELDGVRRGDQNAIKNFVTTTSDRYRGAYQRTAEEHPRQCVLAGTSNKGAFLRDETGERRYWIMPVAGTGDKGELNGFREEVDQLWAEAVEAWAERVETYWNPDQCELEKADLYLYLRDDELSAWMDRVRAQYKMPDEDKLDVTDYLERLRPDNWESLSADKRRAFFADADLFDKTKCTYRCDRISIKEIRNELFGQGGANNKGYDRTYHLADILNNLPGWKQGSYAYVKGYGENVKRQTWIRRGGRYDKAEYST